MSTHDRGAFGKLLAEATEMGCPYLTFHVVLGVDDEDDNASTRWFCRTQDHPDGFGRTGEEALRALVESLRSRT